VWGFIRYAEMLWAAITATVAQDVDYGGIPIWKMVWHVMLSFFLIPVFKLFESLLVINAILVPPTGFHVIVKV
jgi:hypothetical protein